MKKIIVALLAIWMIASLASCGDLTDIDYQGPLAVKRLETTVDGVQAETIMDMTEEAQAKILSALNSGEWSEGELVCGHNYKFTTKAQDIWYHSYCGTVYDVTNKRTMVLSQEERTAMNKLFDAAVPVDKETTVNMLVYDEESHVSQVTITHKDLAYYIASTLKSLKETGRTVVKISDSAVHRGDENLPVDDGTVWLEVDSAIYRLTPEFDQIFLMEAHLGAGVELQMEPAFKEFLLKTKEYYPNNLYEGTYTTSTGELNLVHIYEVQPKLDAHIRSIEIKNIGSQKSDGEIIKIVLEIHPFSDGMFYIEMNNCKPGSYCYDLKEVTFEEGVPQIVELEMKSEYTRKIYIDAGDTVFGIKIAE